MPVITPIARWLDDRCNPILVKEARQAVRSRTVITMLIIELLALLFLTGGTAIFQGGGTQTLSGNGLEIFMIMNGGIMLLCCVGVPAYVASKLAAESKGASADLMFTTSIGAASIVWGKVAVALMLALMLLSAAAPFLVVSYLLRGIDLPTIAFILATDIVIVLACVQVAITIAAFPISAVFRVIAALCVLPFVLYASSMSTFGVIAIGGVSVASFTIAIWAGIVAAALLVVGFTGMLFTLTVSMLMPEQVDRAVLPRVYATLLWGVTLAGATILANTLADAAPMLAWTIAWVVLASVGMMLASGERRTVGNRIRRTLPKQRFLVPPRSLYMSGSATGLIWCTMLTAATIAVWYAALPFFPNTVFIDDDYGHAALNTIAIAPYVLACCLVAMWIRDRLLARWFKPGITVAISVVIFGLASTIPLIIAAILDPRNWDYNPVTAALVPLGPVMFGESIPDLAVQALGIGGAAAVFMLLVHARSFLRQLATYRRLEADTPEPVTLNLAQSDQGTPA